MVNAAAMSAIKQCITRINAKGSESSKKGEINYENDDTNNLTISMKHFETALQKIRKKDIGTKTTASSSRIMNNRGLV
jgi:hypothetical protein